MAENRVIGRDGGLPWRLPDDLRHVKRLTLGGVVIMGRRTFESVGRPLPERTTIVLTRAPGFDGRGALVARDLDSALRLAAADPRGAGGVFVLGGAGIYALALERAGRMELTLVHASLAGDTSFPEFDRGVWRLRAERFHPADERHVHAFTFQTWERVTPPPEPRSGDAGRSP